MEWIIIVLLIAAALVPLIMWLSHSLQEKGVTAGETLNAKNQDEISTTAQQHHTNLDGLKTEGTKAIQSSEGLSGGGSGASFDNGEGGGSGE